MVLCCGLLYRVQSLVRTVSQKKVSYRKETVRLLHDIEKQHSVYSVIGEYHDVVAGDVTVTWLILHHI